MNITIHQLLIFTKVVELESVTKAAEILHMTQPAISIQLKNLQDQLGMPITEVLGRKLFITDYGKEIYSIAKNMIAEMEDIHVRTQAYRGFMTGTLRFAVVSTGKYVLPYFLTEFKKKHPQINLVIDVTNKSRVLETLEKNETDFALISVMPENLSLSFVDLLPNHLFLIANKENAALHQDLKSLLELPIIFREQGSGTRFVMESYLKQHNLTLNKTMELVSNEAVKQALIAGLGYSIMPLIGIKNELSLGELQILPWEGLPIKSQWRLVWNISKNLSPLALEYTKHLERSKNDILEKHFVWLKDYVSGLKF